MTSGISAILIVSTKFTNFLGWLGSGFYLLAYLLLSMRKLKSDTVLYHALNIVGALGMIIHAVFLDDQPNIIVNLVWGFIAAIAISLILSKKVKS